MSSLRTSINWPIVPSMQTRSIYDPSCVSQNCSFCKKTKHLPFYWSLAPLIMGKNHFSNGSWVVWKSEFAFKKKTEKNTHESFLKNIFREQTVLSENTATQQQFSTTEDIFPRVITSQLKQTLIRSLRVFRQAVGVMTISPFLQLMCVHSKILNSLV